MLMTEGVFFFDVMSSSSFVFCIRFSEIFFMSASEVNLPTKGLSPSGLRCAAQAQPTLGVRLHVAEDPRLRLGDYHLCAAPLVALGPGVDALRGVFCQPADQVAER